MNRRDNTSWGLKLVSTCSVYGPLTGFHGDCDEPSCLLDRNFVGVLVESFNQLFSYLLGH